MKKRQKNKLNMFIFTNETCNEYQSDWANIKVFKKAKKEFEEVIDDIFEELKTQQMNYTGITKQRRNTSAKLIDISTKFVGVLKMYSIEANDDVLKAEISYTKSNLYNSRDTLLCDKCQIIYTRAEKYKEGLSDYGIDESYFHEFGRLLKEFRNSLTKSKEAILEKTLATENLVRLFKRGDFILKNKLDNLMYLFNDNNNEFYFSYKYARKIIHAGVRHKRVDHPIENAA